MKIRKILFLTIVLFTIFMIPNVVKASIGDELKIDGFKYEILTETEGDYTVKLTGYEGALEDVEIPSSVTSGVNTYTVTSIGEMAFWLNNKQVKSIEIPNSITEIQPKALNGSEELKEIVVDNGNTKYSSENGVLFNKDKTELICYPEGKADKSYTVPNTVKVIGYLSFYRCELIEELIMQEGVTKIDDLAFLWCSALKEVTIPNSVTTIGTQAFDVCKSLESIEIPNSVTTIGERVFESCEKLDNVVIPSSINSIVDRMFYGCSSLKNITIPNTVTSIGENAFTSCSSLQSIEIPNSVTEIKAGAFSHCASLENVIIPDSVISIGNGVLASCPELKTKIYYVTNSLTNILSSNNKNYVLSDTDYYTTTLSANDGYKLPETITVKVGDKELNDVNNIYDASTGKVSIPTNLIDGDIEIIATGIKKIKVVLNANGGEFEKEKTSLTFEDWNNEEYEYDHKSGKNNLEKPTKKGYEFLGYFTKKTGGTKIDNIMAEAGISEDMIFYAQWEKVINNPQTGDNILLYVSILAISVIGIFSTTKFKNIVKNK